MKSSPVIERQTKYCSEILNILKLKGHATNTEILIALKKKYPDISATTVHRATVRLSFRGKIRGAPKDKLGLLRYDSNLNDHDHFLCVNCGCLRDIIFPRDIISKLEAQTEDCRFIGNLTITGICKACSIKGDV